MDGCWHGRDALRQLPLYSKLRVGNHGVDTAKGPRRRIFLFCGGAFLSPINPENIYFQMFRGEIEAAWGIYCKTQIKRSIMLYPYVQCFC